MSFGKLSGRVIIWVHVYVCLCLCVWRCLGILNFNVKVHVEGWRRGHNQRFEILILPLIQTLDARRWCWGGALADKYHTIVKACRRSFSSSRRVIIH